MRSGAAPTHRRRSRPGIRAPDVHPVVVPENLADDLCLSVRAHRVALLPFTETSRPRRRGSEHRRCGLPALRRRHLGKGVAVGGQPLWVDGLGLRRLPSSRQRCSRLCDRPRCPCIRVVSHAPGECIETAEIRHPPGPRRPRPGSARRDRGPRQARWISRQNSGLVSRSQEAGTFAAVSPTPKVSFRPRAYSTASGRRFHGHPATRSTLIRPPPSEGLRGGFSLWGFPPLVNGAVVSVGCPRGGPARGAKRAP